jgi:hypothetical protein
MMELHAIRGDRRDHVLTTHRAEEDETALQLVSAKKVAYWQTLEADYQVLLEKLGEKE